MILPSSAHKYVYDDNHYDDDNGYASSNEEECWIEWRYWRRKSPNDHILHKGLPISSYVLVFIEEHRCIATNGCTA